MLKQFIVTLVYSNYRLVYGNYKQVTLVYSSYKLSQFVVTIVAAIWDRFNKESLTLKLF